MELDGAEWRLVHGLVMPNSFLGPNFPGMRGLILVLMSNVCYLAVIFIFLEVTWWLLFVTARCLVVTGGYCSLPLVTARFHF